MCSLISVSEFISPPKHQRKPFLTSNDRVRSVGQLQLQVLLPFFSSVPSCHRQLCFLSTAATFQPLLHIFQVSLRARDMNSLSAENRVKLNISNSAAYSFVVLFFAEKDLSGPCTGELWVECECAQTSGPLFLVPYCRWMERQRWNRRTMGTMAKQTSIGRQRKGNFCRTPRFGLSSPQ